MVGCAERTRSIATLIGQPVAPEPTPLEQQLRAGKVQLAAGTPAKPVKRRIAVVIGNSNYTGVSPLDNPRRDATAMATLLREQGFQVIRGYDLSKRDFERVLRDTVVHGGPDADILAFYAGHGFQVRTNNYLVPVDARLTSENDLPFQTVRLESIVEIMDGRSRRQLSFLDACRNNPFQGQAVKPGILPQTATPEIGFSDPLVPAGGLIAYSTGPGALAFDGEGEPNSPYTASLLRRVRSDPAANIARTLRSVQRDVTRATGGAQRPTWTSRLEDRFALAEPATALASAGDATELPQVADTAQSVALPVQPVQNAVTVTTPLEKTVALGDRIAAALDLPANARLDVETPKTGALAALSVSGNLVVPKPEMAASALVYRPDLTERPAPKRIGDAVLRDDLSVSVLIPGQPRQKVDVSIVLVPTACDFEAADWIDPGGIGLYRSDAALIPDKAIAACLNDRRTDPSNGRIHYLLGKAFEADGNSAQAQQSYLAAADLGHLRASAALGRLALAAGDQAAALGHFAKGVAGGDPLAMELLGTLRLGRAATPGERDAAFDLLSTAIDLGMPGAMRALADHFDIPDTPAHDSGRAAVFDREADAREAALATASSGTGLGGSDPDRGGEGGDDGGSSRE